MSELKKKLKQFREDIQVSINNNMGTGSGTSFIKSEWVDLLNETINFLDTPTPTEPECPCSCHLPGNMVVGKCGACEFNHSNAIKSLTQPPQPIKGIVEKLEVIVERAGEYCHEYNCSVRENGECNCWRSFMCDEIQEVVTALKSMSGAEPDELKNPIQGIVEKLEKRYLDRVYAFFKSVEGSSGSIYCNYLQDDLREAITSLKSMSGAEPAYYVVEDSKSFFIPNDLFVYEEWAEKRVTKESEKVVPLYRHPVPEQPEKGERHDQLCDFEKNGECNCQYKKANESKADDSEKAS